MKNAVILSLAVALAHCARADDKVDFATIVKPVLEKRCLECHGAKKSKADLRLDTKEFALKGGEDGKVIIPGKSGESDLAKRISLPDGHDDIMPPKGDPLTKEQIASIKLWIDQGAVWPDGLTLGLEEHAAEAPKTAGKKSHGSKGFANLTPTKDAAAEQEAVKQLASLGISVRPIAQNLEWKEATVRPQDTNKTSEAVALLKNIPSLVDLNLASLHLKDDDLKSLAALKNLQRLHLENNPVTGAGLAHLAGLVNLEYLNLYNTQVGDDGVPHLTGLTNLLALYLWQSKVTDQGAADLKKALPETYLNRGEELTLLAKVEEKKAEEKKAEEAKKADEKKEAKAEPKKEEKPAAAKEEKKAEEKK